MRWVGGYGRMDSDGRRRLPRRLARSRRQGAASAVKHLNEDHAHNLLDMARVLAGHPDATEAQCARIDRYGLDLDITTPGGRTTARIAFAEPATAPGGLRAATVELARRARA